MKKITALLCAICMLCLLPGALAAPGDALLFTSAQRDELGIENYNTPTMAVLGDTLYILCGETIFSLKAGETTPVAVASDMICNYYSTIEDAQEALGDEAVKLISLLVSDGETLYGLNTLTGSLSPLTFADGKATFGTPIQLDWSVVDDLKAGDNYVDISNPQTENGVLYLFMRSDNDYNSPTLLSFNLATGEEKTLDVPCLQDVTPYRDGKLLVEIYDYSTAYDENTGEFAKPTLAVLDPADGTTTNVGSFDNSNVFGLAYDTDSDTFYYATNSRLMAMASLGEPTLVAYLPVDYANNLPARLLPGGLYAIDTWDGLIVRNTDPSYLPASSLSIYGGYMDNVAMAFMAENPDVPLSFDQNTYYDTASALAQAMASGDDTSDIFSIELSYQDFTNLMSKGYCMDLSPYTQLTDSLNSLYPFIQNAITKDGAYYAVPTSLYGYGLSIYPEAWENAGLTDKVPTSFMGLMDFIQWWLDEGMDDHADIQLFDNTSEYGDTLFQLALDLYINQYQSQGEALTLDTPEFREMLGAIEDLDIDALNDTLPETDEDAAYSGISMDSDNTTYLFTNYGDWLCIDASNDYSKPLMLPIEDGGQACIPVHISCMFVNPNTPHPELAVQYLSYIVENMDDLQHIMMFPDDNDPVPNKYYEQMVSEVEKALADAKTSLETAAPEDVKDIQYGIDSYEDFLSKKDRYYWTASAESIAAYRGISSLCYAATPNILNYSGNNEGVSEIYSLIQRYEQKQITLDQFVSQADQKIRMIQLEGQ